MDLTVRSSRGFLLFPRRHGELVDPSDDFGPARIGEMDSPGDFVDGEPGPGKKPLEIPNSDAGEDVPELRPLPPFQLGRAKGARQRRAAWPLGHARQVVGGE